MYIRTGSIALPTAGSRFGALAQNEAHVCRPGEGPPAAVPDPEGKGPHPLVYRGVIPKRSRNPSVGDAQILLNRFLQQLREGTFRCRPGADLARIEAIRRTLTQDPLVVDCRFGPNTEKATLMFQRCVFPEDRKQWDGKIGPKTWRELIRLRGTTPPPPPSPPIEPPESRDERVRRLLRLLDQQSLPGDTTGEPTRRVRCLLNKMLRPDVRDMYVNGLRSIPCLPQFNCPGGFTTLCGFQGNFGKFDDLPLPVQAAFFQTVKIDLRSRFFGRNASTSETLAALESLDNRIFRTIACLNAHVSIHGIASDNTRLKLHNFIAKEQKDERSIYHCYR